MQVDSEVENEKVAIITPQSLDDELEKEAIHMADNCEWHHHVFPSRKLMVDDSRRDEEACPPSTQSGARSVG